MVIPPIKTLVVRPHYETAVRPLEERLWALNIPVTVIKPEGRVSEIHVDVTDDLVADVTYAVAVFQAMIASMASFDIEVRRS